MSDTLLKDVRTVKGIVVAHQDLGLYEGMIPVSIEETEAPTLHWKGAKIASGLWNQIKSFMRWTYEEYKSEAQLRLYYNEVVDEWDVVVLPQHVETGLSSKEIADHEARETILASFPESEGWREAGTVHHHCSISAFQSGTDFNDEKDKNGLHITLGHMADKDTHSFDARASFRKMMYHVNPDEWVDSEILIDDANKFQVTVSEESFPETWKTYLIPKPKVVYQPRTYPASRGRTYTGFGAYAWGDGYDAYYDDWYGDYNSRQESEVEASDVVVEDNTGDSYVDRDIDSGELAWANECIDDLYACTGIKFNELGVENMIDVADAIRDAYDALSRISPFLISKLQCMEALEQVFLEEQNREEGCMLLDVMSIETLYEPLCFIEEKRAKKEEEQNDNTVVPISGGSEQTTLPLVISG